MQRDFGVLRRWFPRLCARLPIVVLGVCVSSILCSCGKPGPDASTPKKAALLFANASQAGDVNAMRQVAVGTDAEFELAKGFGQVTAAFNRFSAAASAKFGTDANTRHMSIDLATDADSADEKIDGDSALLIPKSDEVGETAPYAFKKDGKNWKLDLSFLDRDATAKEKSEKLIATIPLWDKATKEIEAGKFDTFAHAKAAMVNRLYRSSLNEAEGKIVAAREDILSIEDAIERYKADAAEYPQTSDGLLSLVQKPASASNWHGPYLKSSSLVSDPWGHAYVYVCPGIHNINAYDLHSMGPDGKDMTRDDIDNWTVEAAK